MVKYTKRKVEFNVTQLPNDMKMLSYLAGELSNAATYFSTFANVLDIKIVMIFQNLLV